LIAVGAVVSYLTLRPGRTAVADAGYAGAMEAGQSVSEHAEVAQ
jgi:hypothetical protein